MVTTIKNNINLVMEAQDEPAHYKQAKPQREHGFLERQARRVARRPRTHLWSALFLTIAISILGMWRGQVRIGFETIGWPSRGTLIADRQSHLPIHRWHCLVSLFESHRAVCWICTWGRSCLRCCRQMEESTKR
jgi:hypothetical protein